MRKPREKKSGVKYHVTARINLQMMLFEYTHIKELFLVVLRQAKRKYHFRICHFAIMDNHVHLIVEPIEDEDLSVIMRWILSVFAMRYNRMFNLKGHVWYDRFGSRIIETLNYYRAAFCYISNNPVKARMTKTIYEYRYTGLFHLMRRFHEVVDPPDILLQHLFPYLPVS